MIAIIRTAFTCSLIVITPIIGTAQISTYPNQQTTTPSSARFEIIQSPIAARWTFRLDRYSGRIDQIASTVNNRTVWESMEIEGLPIITNPTKPRFMIFTSGIAVRHTYLMDTDTGRTWVLVSGKRKRPTGGEYDIHLWEELLPLFDP